MKIKENDALLIISIVFFIISIFLLRYYLDTTRIIAESCHRQIFITGYKINHGFRAYFNDDKACAVNFGKYGIWNRWDVGSCANENEPIIEEVTEYKCY